MSKYYSGIGSRQTPKDICELMTRIARKLAQRSYTLRSGGADGADKAFERGTGPNESQILRPNHATPEAIQIASEYHPVWDKCSEWVRKLHGRNSQILLGYGLDEPAEFVICWAANERSGGTALGIKIARAYNIRVNNLFNSDVLGKVVRWLGAS